MVDHDGDGRAEQGEEPRERGGEGRGEGLGRKLRQVSDKIGCAANVALDHFGPEQGPGEA